MHRIFLPTLTADLPIGSMVVVDAEEARHAIRVKRLEPGERVELFNAAGLVAGAALERIEKDRDAGWIMGVRISEIRERAPLTPRIEVFASAPKGDRLDQMIDQLSQVGAASWTPLITERTVVEPRAGKLERLERIAIESAKQCGRDWAIRIGEPVELATLLRSSARTIVADASGRSAITPSVADETRLLVGPEGGWTPEELKTLANSGASIVRFGECIMRVETAAVAGVSIVMDVARRG